MAWSGAESATDSAVYRHVKIQQDIAGSRRDARFGGEINVLSDHQVNGSPNDMPTQIRSWFLSSFLCFFCILLAARGRYLIRWSSAGVDEICTVSMTDV